MPPIQITGTLFNHSIPAIIHSERAGIRTPDNLIKSQVLYQLSYTPLFNYIPFNYKENAQSRNRTSDTRIFSPLLYQLSYLGLNTIYLCKLREQELNVQIDFSRAVAGRAAQFAGVVGKIARFKSLIFGVLRFGKNLAQLIVYVGKIGRAHV